MPACLLPVPYPHERILLESKNYFNDPSIIFQKSELKKRKRKEVADVP